LGFDEDQRRQRFNDISPEQIAYLRAMLDTHSSDPSTGHCRACGVRTCPDWRYAYDRLAAAGQLMAEPERWQQPSDWDERG
jgi:hypothetical protein